MLDLAWERAAPVYRIDEDGINQILSGFDARARVDGFRVIALGCRNSNFEVLAGGNKYLLRIAEDSFNNEKAVFGLLEGKINIPKLLYSAVWNGVNVFIYEFIEGLSFQKVIIDNNGCSGTLLRQAARAAAVIHNTTVAELSDIQSIDTPPFETWFDYFLGTSEVQKRLGGLYDDIRRLVDKKRKLIPQIDEYISLIHCDFRPINMLVDNDGKLYIVDWEYSGIGHSLADIGQFFRYRRYFNDADFKLFEQAYNSYASTPLPSNWVELSLFRDLINPLQMLGSKQERPLQCRDLINIIRSALDFWRE